MKGTNEWHDDQLIKRVIDNCKVDQEIVINKSEVINIDGDLWIHCNQWKECSNNKACDQKIN